MSKIKVYFKDTKIGELGFVGNNYIYKTDKKGIDEAQNKGYPLFIFGIDKDFISDTLPVSISSLIPDEKQVLTNNFANILPNDSDFEKLCKIASKDFAFENVGLKL